MGLGQEGREDPQESLTSPRCSGHVQVTPTPQKGVRRELRNLQLQDHALEAWDPKAGGCESFFDDCTN